MYAVHHPATVAIKKNDSERKQIVDNDHDNYDDDDDNDDEDDGDYDTCRLPMSDDIIYDFIHSIGQHQKDPHTITITHLGMNALK